MTKGRRNPAEPSDCRVVVMMTRQERADLDEMAVAAGMNISQYLRWRAKSAPADVASIAARLERLEAHLATHHRAVSR